MLFLGLLVSVIGIWASATIYRSKRQKKKMVCPLRASCDTVIHSHYSKTLGVSNDTVGMLYFSGVGFLISVSLLTSLPPGLEALLLLMTTAGALFSLYLLFVQFFTIRAWCSWCTLTALASISLWCIIHALLSTEVLSLFAQTKFLWVLIHNVGFILGIGGATITDVFFFRFLKDFKITAEEKEHMDHLSQIIWVGLIVLVLSGYFLYLPQQALLLQSSKFLLKLIVVAVIVVNGIFLNLSVAPALISLSFEDISRATKRRALAFALGAISLSSWYSAFLLGSLRSIPISLSLGALVYGGILFLAVLGSRFLERSYIRRHHHQSSLRI